ncbi:iron transporter [Hygrophoropsis aurantiaca]|uniref:Iron transporter n=1 Tax=Hygrophoropsis aurantiaca TaxID=72124 RepID=A0ACB8AP25_9AGAM|nr:iron transporter [Hygrophoropsis aurantiaca]
MLSVLRFSSSTFAFYLFLVTLFPSTLLPASIYGFSVTGTGILFSSSVGTLIDKHNRLTIVRCATLGQKLTCGISYALFLMCFLTPLGRIGGLSGPLIAVFIGMVLCGAILKVATVCLTISIERDWASTIGKGHSQRLVKLNTWIRRVDLVCDLVSPLFVSALTAGVSYSFATAFLAGMTAVSFVLEMVLSGITYRRFPELSQNRNTDITHGDQSTIDPRSQSFGHRLLGHLDPRELIRDFEEFRKLPVFYTSLSIASIYLTVLSFDGTMLTFLKDARKYTDPFIAGQRAACTAAGLTGTILFPILSRKLGVVRTGSWSIWSEFMCLIPVVASLYFGAPESKSNTPEAVPEWNAAMLFGGMALSRIGLWMFDLAQLQILQESLESNPRRNRLTSLQYTLQNVFDMAKYALTMGLASPSNFRWAGLVSVIAVFVGGVLYTFGYARIVRGHVAPHWRKVKLP